MIQYTPVLKYSSVFIILVWLPFSAFSAWNESYITVDYVKAYSLIIGDGRGEGVNCIYIRGIPYSNMNSFATHELSYTGGGWLDTDMGDSGTPYYRYKANLVIGRAESSSIQQIYSCSDFLNKNTLYVYTYSNGNWTSDYRAIEPWDSNYSIQYIGLGQGRNDGKVRLYSNGISNYLTEYTYNSVSGNYTAGQIDQIVPTVIFIGAGRGDGVNRVYCTSGTSIYEYTYSGGVWNKVNIGSCSGQNMVSLIIGNGRNDGKIRLYAWDKSTNIYEFTYSSGTWNKSLVKNISYLPSGTTNSENYYQVLALGAGHNDGTIRLYATSEGGLLELTYSGGSWQQTDRLDWNEFNSIIVGEGRDDGINRVYSCSLQTLTEFTYQYAASTITVTNPVGGENWPQGTDHEITWTSENAGSDVKIELHNGDGYSTITSSTPNNGSYWWHIPSDQVPRTDYSIKLIDNSNTSINYRTQDFTISENPTLTVQSEPDTGVYITVSPNDNNENGNGYTNFTRTYNSGVNVSLTAPESYNGMIFGVWTLEGGVYSESRSTTIIMDDSYTLVAMYYYLSIQGYVLDSLGTPISDVIMNLSGDAFATTTTNEYGYYFFGSLPIGNYTVTPSKTNYTFTPPPRIYSPLTSYQYDQNYTGAYNQSTYRITGYVRDSSSNGISGVTMTLSGDGSQSIATDTDGYYIFTGLIAGNYTVTPSKNEYTFEPPDWSHWIDANENAIDFTGTGTTSSSITVTNPVGGEDWPRGTDHEITWTSENAGSDVKIELHNGDGYSTITSSTPNNGSYWWHIPSDQIPRTDYSIKLIDNSNSSINYRTPDFTISTSSYYHIAGYVRDSVTSNGISGVTMTLSGTVSKVTTTDGNGYYIFTDLVAGDYMVTPSKSGYTFYPPDWEHYVNANKDGLDFTGTGTLPSSITVTNPVGGEDWPRGTDHEITWTSENAGSDVKIELHNGDGYSTITASTPNDGSYWWHIPSDQTPRTDYSIKLIDNSTSSVNYRTQDFIISGGVDNWGVLPDIKLLKNHTLANAFKLSDYVNAGSWTLQYVSNIAHVNIKPDTWVDYLTPLRSSYGEDTVKYVAYGSSKYPSVVKYSSYLLKRIPDALVDNGKQVLYCDINLPGYLSKDSGTPNPSYWHGERYSDPADTGKLNVTIDASTVLHINPTSKLKAPAEVVVSAYPSGNGQDWDAEIVHVSEVLDTYGEFTAASDTTHYWFELPEGVNSLPTINWLGNYSSRNGVLKFGFSNASQGVKIVFSDQLDMKPYTWYCLRCLFKSDAGTGNKHQGSGQLFMKDLVTGLVEQAAFFHQPGLLQDTTWWGQNAYIYNNSNSVRKLRPMLVLKNNGSSGSIYIDYMRVYESSPFAERAYSCLAKRTLPNGSFDNGVSDWYFGRPAQGVNPTTPLPWYGVYPSVFGQTNALAIGFSQTQQGLKLTSNPVVNITPMKSTKLSWKAYSYANNPTRSISGRIYCIDNVGSYSDCIGPGGVISNMPTGQWVTYKVEATPVLKTETQACVQIVVKNGNVANDAVYLDDITLEQENDSPYYWDHSLF